MGDSVHILVHVESNWGQRESVYTMTDMIKCPESPVLGYMSMRMVSRDVALFFFLLPYIRHLDKPEYCFSVADPSHIISHPAFVGLGIFPTFIYTYSWLTPSLRNKYLNFSLI